MDRQPAVPISISVIIAAQAGGQALAACLAGLAEQHFTGSYEAIVVLAPAAAKTKRPLAEAFPALPVQMHSLDRWNAAQAFNHGAEQAQGQICLFLDEEERPNPGLLEAHWQAQSEQTGCIGLGLTQPQAPAHDWLAQCYAEEQVQCHHTLAGDNTAAHWAWHPQANVSVPRAGFLAAGGFDAALSTQIAFDLAYRLEKDGLALRCIPDGLAWQAAPAGRAALISLLEKQGAACIALYQHHPAKLARIIEDYGALTWRAQWLRGLLLALHFPAACLAALLHITVKSPKRRADWYAFLRSYCFWCGVRQAVPNRDTWRRLTYGTPILMYHAFAGPGERTSRYIIGSHQFTWQMAWLKCLRYRVISLEAFLQCRREGRMPPARSVVITIDDGYADNASVAYPILRGFGFPATIFLISQRLGQTNDWDSDGYLPGRATLSEGQVRQLSAAKISFGSHTRTHPFLPTITAEQARDEIIGSRLDLEQLVQQPVVTFSYPHGEFNHACQVLVKEGGYWGACSTHSELNYLSAPLTALWRTEVRGTDSFLRFILALTWGDKHLPPRRHRGKE